MTNAVLIERAVSCWHSAPANLAD